MITERRFATSKLGLIWFGASVSLAEILTGTFFAPLGLTMGLAAIVVGHIIGCVLFHLVALVSAQTGASAMEAVARSFGHVGSGAFSLANVLQLVGWTAIMVMSGGAAAELLVPALGMAGWCIVIGALIVLWIAIGVKRMGVVQSVTAVLLFALTLIMSVTIFGAGSPPSAIDGDGLSFGAAVELAAAMPLSWLPVVGDYTREAEKPLPGTMLSTVAYGIGSCWMFAIGLGCALFAGSDDVAVVLAHAGMGVVGIVVVVLSTVTTTFLDAQSAGVSANAIHGKLDAKVCGIVAAVIGTALAVFAPVGDFEDFLYLIGSVFAPMATIVCVDFFILRRDVSDSTVDWHNVIWWIAGFALYRFSLTWDIPCGNTFPVMVVIALATVLVGKLPRVSPKP